MKETLLFLKKNIALIGIICFVFSLGLFLRFGNFENRWTLSQDQARDAIIARFAIESGQIPVIGPHSSAGDFSFGPLYYWLIIFFTFFSQQSINGGWVGFTFLSCLTVLVFTWVGYKLDGKFSAFIFGIVSALSAGAILHAPDMLNPIPIPLFISLGFLFLLYFFSTRKVYFALLSGCMIGLATQLHFQTLIILPLFYITSVLFYKRVPIEVIESAMEKGAKKGGISGFFKSFKHLWKVSMGPRTKKRLLVLGYLLAGFFIGIAPIIYFDLGYGNKLFANFLQFYLYGQKNMAVYISWYEDLFKFWPKFFGEVLLNLPKSGYLILLIITISTAISITKHKAKSVFIAAVSLSFVLQVLLLHFYKGPRSTVYMLVFHPFVILIFAWSIWVLSKVNRNLGIVLLLIFGMIALIQDFNITEQENNLDLVRQNQSAIYQKTQGKIELYEKDSSTMISYPVFFLINHDQKLDHKGYRIGLCEDKDLVGSMGEDLGRNCPKEPSPFQGDGHYLIYDLNGISEERLEELGFQKMSKSKIYNKLYEGYTF